MMSYLRKNFKELLREIGEGFKIIFVGVKELFRCF